MDQTTSIQNLQKMLDQLSQAIPTLPRLAMTGIFDEPTLEAVMTFQRDFHPPVTGIVDEDTWYTIEGLHRKMRPFYSGPSTLRPLSAYTDILTMDMALIIDSLFISLASRFDNFAGKSSPDSRRQNLLALQKAASLPESGEPDPATWDFLTRLYHAAIARSTS